jgi:hypothetical protein
LSRVNNINFHQILYKRFPDNRIVGLFGSWSTVRNRPNHCSFQLLTFPPPSLRLLLFAELLLTPWLQTGMEAQSQLRPVGGLAYMVRLKIASTINRHAALVR